MYSLALKEQQDRLRAERERYQRLKLDPPTPQSQERLTRRVYGRTRDQLADGYSERAQSFVQERLEASASEGAGAPAAGRRSAPAPRAGGGGGAGGRGGCPPQLLHLLASGILHVFE